MQVYIIEANPRASRTVPFVAKAVGHPLAKYASLLMSGQTLPELGFTEEPRLRHVAVKEAVLPFEKFPGVWPCAAALQLLCCLGVGHAHDRADSAEAGLHGGAAPAARACQGGHAALLRSPGSPALCCSPTTTLKPRNSVMSDPVRAHVRRVGSRSMQHESRRRGRAAWQQCQPAVGLLGQGLPPPEEG